MGLAFGANRARAHEDRVRQTASRRRSVDRWDWEIDPLRLVGAGDGTVEGWSASSPASIFRSIRPGVGGGDVDGRGHRLRAYEPAARLSPAVTRSSAPAAPAYDLARRMSDEEPLRLRQTTGADPAPLRCRRSPDRHRLLQRLATAHNATHRAFRRKCRAGRADKSRRVPFGLSVHLRADPRVLRRRPGDISRSGTFHSAARRIALRSRSSAPGPIPVAQVSRVTPGGTGSSPGRAPPAPARRAAGRRPGCPAGTSGPDPVMGADDDHPASPRSGSVAASSKPWVIESGHGADGLPPARPRNVGQPVLEPLAALILDFGVECVVW